MLDGAFRETITRLEEVNEVIQKLDPSIREAAFQLFLPYVKATFPGTVVSEKIALSAGTTSPSLEELMRNHPNAAAHENAYILAAHWYAEYGIEPFSLEGMKSLGNNAGMTLPERLDMTYKQAKSEGKASFQVISRGSYKPTVAGEGWLRATYGVSKGKQKLTPAENK